MFKRVVALILASSLFFSVECSALELTKVTYKTPVNGLGKQLTVILDSEIQNNTIFIAQYSLSGRLQHLNMVSAANEGASPGDFGIYYTIYPESLPVKVKIFAWSSDTSIYPVSNCYDLLVSDTNAIFRQDMPGFLEDLTQEYFPPGNERSIKTIIINVGNAIMQELESVEMTRSYLETRFSAEIAQAKSYYAEMTADEQAGFKERLMALTDPYPELRTCLLEMFGLI